MSIDGTAIESIADLAQRAEKQEFLRIPGDQGDVHYWKLQTGELIPYRTDPPHVRHSFRRPEDLKHFVEMQHVMHQTGPESCYFVSQDLITYVWKRFDGRDVATCPLTFTEQFKLLQSLGTHPQTQKQMIRALRVYLAGMVGTGPELLMAIRELKFAASSDVESGVQHGNESISQSVRKRLNGADRIPEETIVTIDVFNEFTCPMQIRCSVDIDVEEQKISLVPIGRAITEAIDGTIAAIVKTLEFEGGPEVFAGKLRG